ncbi:MAG: PilZ domain-containing protein [Desulfobulbaceae bacterium]|nr:PilZ domain-containing protein [Desulfobulbaceae bacterium]
MMSNERRILQRYPEQSFIDLIILRWNNSNPEMKFHKEKIKDFSKNGIRIESYNKYTIDTIVSFLLSFKFASKHISGIGKIKWYRYNKEDNKYEYGIYFLNNSNIKDIKELTI